MNCNSTQTALGPQNSFSKKDIHKISICSFIISLFSDVYVLLRSVTIHVSSFCFYVFLQKNIFHKIYPISSIRAYFDIITCIHFVFYSVTYFSTLGKQNLFKNLNILALWWVECVFFYLTNKLFSK